MTTPTNQPPDENKLRLMLANGLTDVVQQIIESHKLQYIIENGQLKDSITGTELHLKRFITTDPLMIQLKSDVHRMAKSQHEVLICGETGTGKETIARAMIGQRTGKTVGINCAGLVETLIESELFGYVKGSFTGAVGDRQGLLAAAKDGVAFLDEIGELPISVQAKLLRAIQEKQIRRVGAIVDEPISCKIVCATHRNLEKMVTAGTFREDLFARISTLELNITPLRNRTCDIVPIIQSLKSGKDFLEAIAVRSINPVTLDTRYNVRSLQQHVARFEVLGRVVGC
jgi:transcriptional regulator with PAS, ATPase and Fis domain